MSNQLAEFSDHHAQQYKVVSDDMRFLADQRFKITTVYLLTCGFLLNVAKDRQSMILAAIGMLISYMCFCWDAATTRWWGTLIEQAKQIEDLAHRSGQMIAVYHTYRNQNPIHGVHKLAKVKPTNAVATIYIMGMTTWALYLIYSLGCWW